MTISHSSHASCYMLSRPSMDQVASTIQLPKFSFTGLGRAIPTLKPIANALQSLLDKALSGQKFTFASGTMEMPTLNIPGAEMSVESAESKVSLGLHGALTLTLIGGQSVST